MDCDVRNGLCYAMKYATQCNMMCNVTCHASEYVLCIEICNAMEYATQWNINAMKYKRNRI